MTGWNLKCHQSNDSHKGNEISQPSAQNSHILLWHSCPLIGWLWLKEMHRGRKRIRSVERQGDNRDGDPTLNLCNTSS